MGWPPTQGVHCRFPEYSPTGSQVSRFTLSFRHTHRQWGPTCREPFHTYAIYTVKEEYLQGATEHSLKALRSIHLSGCLDNQSHTMRDLAHPSPPSQLDYQKHELWQFEHCLPLTHFTSGVAEGLVPRCNPTLVRGFKQIS
jgi:hypothetical protein